MHPRNSLRSIANSTWRSTVRNITEMARSDSKSSIHCDDSSSNSSNPEVESVTWYVPEMVRDFEQQIGVEYA